MSVNQLPGRYAGKLRSVLAPLVLALLFLGISIVPVSAHEWIAHRLRGPVHIVIDNEWVPIARGDVVHSGTIVRTGSSGTVEFRNGPNMVALASDTQVKFIDWSDRGQTWVQQWFGEVEVDVEARNVLHFAVQTPMMVAVVKGTRFTVSSSETESSVNVIRGSVAVVDTARHHQVDLGAGQSVSGGTATEMSVAGGGNLPLVVTAQGRPVTPPAEQARPGQNPSSANRPDEMPRPPMASGGAPGNSGNTPAASGGAQGNSGNTPAGSRGAPDNSGNAPAGSGGAQGNSGNTSAGSGGAPGSSGNAPAGSGGTPGAAGGRPGGN
jgi:hypothetical protein